MLDNLSAKISEFGNNVLLHCEFRTKSHKIIGSNGMVYGLNEQEVQIHCLKTLKIINYDTFKISQSKP
jgi:hypothetical protein